VTVDGSAVVEKSLEKSRGAQHGKGLFHAVVVVVVRGSGCQSDRRPQGEREAGHQRQGGKHVHERSRAAACLHTDCE
jgi:hypothetical protein